ncbi:peptidoglycan DD-metalloendopeptidase family protein [Paludibacterium purpuratum]
MMILPSRRTRLTATLVVLGLCGCSSFVQQPAPVESGSTSARPSTTRTTTESAPASLSTGTGAQTAPYKADAPIGATTAAAKPVAVSADDGKTHVVAPGENLFRISLAHGLKYQQVATWNNLPDFSIKVGQVLRLTPPSGDQPSAVTTASPAATQINRSAGQPAIKAYPKALKLAYSDAAVHAIRAESEGDNRPATPVTVKPTASAPTTVASAPVTVTAPPKESSAPSAAGEDAVAWMWPVNGKTLRGFSDSNKGVDIGGRMGQPVQAAADGKVVYSGNGLRGYGKLIIIKHNKTFLSAYAHNSQLLVKEGQTVKKGQKIAEMGNTDADQVKLHFEIRKFGKPVDPMQYLNSKP